MAVLKPFTAYLPQPQFVQEVCCLPHRPVAREDAEEFFKLHPRSFLRIVHAELEFKSGNASAEMIAASAHAHFDELIADGTLKCDESPGIYIYQLKSMQHTQTGVVACLPLEDFVHGRIKRHENTLPREVAYRAALLGDIKAHPGPCYLLYRAHEGINEQIALETGVAPFREYHANDGVSHRVWRVRRSSNLLAEFSKIPQLYIADGHHRIDAALAVQKTVASKYPGTVVPDYFNYFPAALFPHNQLRVLPFHRAIYKMKLSSKQLIARLQQDYHITAVTNPLPSEKGNLCLYIGDTWYSLKLRHPLASTGDPVESLEVAVFERTVLEPVFGIADQRTDPNIGFIPGTKDIGYMEQLVQDKKVSCIFMLYPTTVEELIAVCDAGKVMAPKSTWFEPKLCSGLLVHRLSGLK